jgi:hypothetical protein
MSEAGKVGELNHAALVRGQVVEQGAHFTRLLTPAYLVVGPVG